MYVIIIGCGRLGSSLARELSDLGHNISILDRDEERLSNLGNGFNGQIINGIEFDNDNLLEAGIREADVLVAVTPDDNINITVSLIAKKVYNIPRIISRINDPGKKYIYDKLGIEAINPVRLGSEIIKERLTVKGIDLLACLDKDYEIIELTVQKEKAGTVSDIETKYSCVISGVFKKGDFLLPHKDQSIERNDKIICTIGKTDRDHIISSLSKEMFI